MKDAYYFSHDANAKDDPKCVMLIEQLGLEGYGIFWVLIETLRDQPGYKYPISLIPALARRYNTTAQKVEAVVRGYNLFEIIDNEFFFSNSLNNRMQHLEYKRQIAIEAGKISAQKRKQKLLNECSTDVQPTFNQRSTSKVKESKGNKSKDIKEINKENLLQCNDNVTESNTEKEIEKKKDKTHSTKPNIKDYLELISNNTTFTQDVKLVLIDWLEYKLEKKEKYTLIGFKKLLTQVENNVNNFGELQVIRLINDCIANNYKGIIWDKLSKSINNYTKPVNKPLSSADELQEMIARGDFNE